MWPERDAVIFAGGGHKGFAYLGALEVLQRQQWNLIAGSSVGSLAALALAAQLPLQAVVDAANALPEFHRGSRGLLQTGGLRELVERALRTRFRTEITFAELHAKIHARLVVTATCVSTQRTHYFDHVTTPHVPVADAVCASMAVPLLFEPHMCNGQPYVDGALHELAPTSVCPTARQLVVHFIHKRRDLPPTMSGALHLILNSLGVLHVGRAALLPIDVGDVALTSLPTILRQRNVSALINEFRAKGLTAARVAEIRQGDATRAAGAPFA